MPTVSSLFGMVGGGNYQIPSQRGFSMTVKVEADALMTIPDRLTDALDKALIFHLAEAAQKVIDTTRHYLVRLSEPPVKDNIHGYDTGLMYVSLKAELMEHLAATGVFYELLSDEAKYWRWVEFGHWMANGQFWPGYHMLETAIEDNAPAIRQAVRAAWGDAVAVTARGSRA